jgi:hypothetical protein
MSEPNVRCIRVLEGMGFAGARESWRAPELKLRDGKPTP